LLAELGSAFSNIVLILLAVAFFLFEASSFPVKLHAVLGNPQQAFPQFTRFVGDIERYMAIKTLISLAAGILIGIWLAILGVDFPITMTLKFACENNKSTRWIAVLLGPEATAESIPPVSYKRTEPRHDIIERRLDRKVNAHKEGRI
jgi:hypothetical protein